jgi:pimeloyl-ACP methyl ester carboxylesterase
MENIIVFSHGFGVDSTARGMFTDIAEAMPERRFRFFEYNHPTPDGFAVASFEEQGHRLSDEIDRAIEQSAGSDQVDLVCHSQGAIAATLVRDTRLVRRAVLLAPPRELSHERMEKVFGGRFGSVRHPDGKLMSIPRRDGSVTTISRTYWDSFLEFDLSAAYARFVCRVPTHAIFADSDEILGTDADSLRFSEYSASEAFIPGDHDFTGEYRTGLILELRRLLA